MDYKVLTAAGAEAARIRNKEIYERWLETKLSYAKLAQEYGISKPRVQQIVQGELKRRTHPAAETPPSAS